MEIKLNPLGWHKKLQRYVFPEIPEFQNFCPYFWITIFCLFAVSFVWLAKTGAGIANRYIIPAMEFLGTKIDWFIENCFCIPLDRLLLLNLDGDSLFNVYDVSEEAFIKRNTWMTTEEAKQEYKERYGDRGVYKGRRNANQKYERWKKLHGDNWQTILDGVVARRKLEQERQAEEENKQFLKRVAAREASAKRIMKLSNATQKVVPYLLWAVLAFVSYLLFNLGVLLVAACHRIHWDRVWTGIKWILLHGSVVVGCCLVIILVFGALFYCVEQLKNRCVWKPSWPKPLAAFGRFCLLPFVGLAALIEFIVEYIKVSKKNYCPKIQWEKP